jgi:hypothetical protein
MFINYNRTCDPAMALAICKAQGLVLAKLASMEATAAGIAYLTTFPTMETEN